MNYIHDIKDEDRKQLLNIKQNWIDNLLNTNQEINLIETENAISSIYKDLNYNSPDKIYYFDSPLELAITACYLINFRNRPKFLYFDSLWLKLWKKFWYHLELDYHEISQEFIWNEDRWDDFDSDENIDEDVNLEIEQILSGPYNNLRNTITSHILEKIWASCDDINYLDNIALIIKQIKKLKINNPGNFLGWSFGNHEGSWICEYLFKYKNLDDNSLAYIKNWETLNNEAGWWIAFENIVLVSKKPVEININDDIQIHSTTKKAIQFQDGWGLYSVFGVLIPDQWGETTVNNWKSEWLIETKNTEHRMALLKVLGYNKVMNDLGSRIIHKQEDSFGNLMELHRIEHEIDIEPIVLLKVICPSTKKIHILRVPPYMHRCETARRWTLFDEKSQFNLFKET